MTKIIIFAGLLFYIGIASFIIYLIYKNINSDNALTQTGILISTIIPILMSATIFLKPKYFSNEYIYGINFDKNTNSFKTLGYEYSLLSDKELTHYKEDDYNNVIDLIEKEIIYLLSDNFHFWDIDLKTYKVKDSIKGFPSREQFSKKSKIEGYTYKEEEINQLFKHNKLISEYSHKTLFDNNIVLGMPIKFQVPPNTRISTNQDEYTREIIFNDTQFGILKITIEPSSFFDGKHSIFIKLNVTANKWNVLSEDFKSYENWYQNIDKVLEKYNIREKK